MSGFFVTGTDTGIGKTFVTVLLLRACVARGATAIGMKPVAAGLEFRGGEWVNDDVLALRTASNVAAPPELVNPYALEEALAPHIAAAHAGVTIELARITSAFADLKSRADIVFVEGVGGFAVPLGTDFDSADLAAALRIPVLLVVGMRLGCLNHALLTVAAVQERGLVLAGWIANAIDPHMAAFDENVAALDARIAAPRVGTVAFHAGTAPARRGDFDLDLIFKPAIDEKGIPE